MSRYWVGGGEVGGDSGLFGPSSVTWHLHADPAMWPGGVRALFLQALHPLAVTGLAQNSAFTQDPVARLLRTGEFIVATTWGTRAQAERAGAMVRSVHSRMRITDPDTGRTVRLDRPDLLRWVHCTLVGSNLDTVRRADPRISDEQADRYVDEQRRIAELVGLNGDDVPGSQRELESYIADTRSLLRCTPEADQVLRFLLRPQLAGRSRLLLPAWAAGAWLSYSLLPRWAHDLYGKYGLSDQTATAALRAARMTAFAVPCMKRNNFPAPYLAEAISRLGRAHLPAPRRLAKWTANSDKPIRSSRA
jgi:uncharacterized protein (DUF2236 family)